jgi:hypothetical protein
MIENRAPQESVPKLALNRVEAAQALGCSPATLDRLTIRGLLRPCRATYRPIYWVKELERFLKENSTADYVRPASSTNGLPGHRANRHDVGSRPQSNFSAVSPSAAGELTINLTVTGNEVADEN